MNQNETLSPSEVGALMGVTARCVRLWILKGILDPNLVDIIWHGSTGFYRVQRAAVERLKAELEHERRLRKENKRHDEG